VQTTKNVEKMKKMVGKNGQRESRKVLVKTVWGEKQGIVYMTAGD